MFNINPKKKFTENLIKLGIHLVMHNKTQQGISLDNK